MPDSQLEKIHDLLDDFTTAMLVTHAQGHPLHARPMAIARLEPNCDLWFFTERDSRKVHDIATDQGVLIVCQDERSSYISVAGRAQLVTDRTQARELWKDSYQTWFPRGLEDPTLMLIFVRAEHAEYWDNRGANGIKYVFEAAKAYASGTKPHIEEGEQHGQAALK